MLGGGYESVLGEFCVFRGWVQLGARGILTRTVKGLENRRPMGPGRAVLSLQVIKEEIEVVQLGPPGR